MIFFSNIPSTHHNTCAILPMSDYQKTGHLKNANFFPQCVDIHTNHWRLILLD